MTSGGRRRSIALFVVLGVCLAVGALALNVSWVLVNWREAGLLVVGILVFPLLIAGVVFNTIFLVREIRRNEQHDAFINAVTHELKTPIASIRLYLQTLQSRQLDEGRRQDFYKVMLEDSERLLQTIEQVLRAGQGGTRLKHRQFAPVDLRALVSECLSLARTRHHLTDVALSYRERLSTDTPPRILGDEDDLRAAVTNLLDNAIKYSGPQVKVSVELEHTETSQATLRVRDQGVGIPQTELKRIFKRFYRARDIVTTRVKGTGLGLFIVRSVIARHGGKVFAESAGPGHGSTFTVELPASPPS
jgi:two-component system, OmpR family, sensor histidine kinase SenX3